ncbi:MAG: hypothetical protein KA717_38955 [Woronichinia naegeliana WA131]|uniref:Uncharacterized protein n=1 Tax=Woronichinia naegeliana WA131 TaxID=2824559 RepID=A0A977PX94_9CYAN|nr:MAG: hypothetical protein KA717_38955 [Woronichinia naegeliana WA131]
MKMMIRGDRDFKRENERRSLFNLDLRRAIAVLDVSMRGDRCFECGDWKGDRSFKREDERRSLFGIRIKGAIASKQIL